MHRITILALFQFAPLAHVMAAQQPPQLTVCEGVQVSLGQTKEQTRNVLAACCSFRNPEFGGKLALNQIIFEARGGSRACSGTLIFDESGKLAFAQRDFGSFQQGSPALDLAYALTMVINNLLPGPPFDHDGSTVKIHDGVLELNVRAGPAGGQNTLLISVGEHTLRFEVRDSVGLKQVVLNEEIGDMRRGDLRYTTPTN